MSNVTIKAKRNGLEPEGYLAYLMRYKEKKCLLAVRLPM